MPTIVFGDCSDADPNMEWSVDTVENHHRCLFNRGTKVWHANICDMYNDSVNHRDSVCNFEIHHDPTGTVFKVPLIVVFSKSVTIRMKVSSDMALDKDRITIMQEETGNVEVIRSLIFYLYTGFLVDLSITDVNDLTSEDAKEVRLSFNLVDLYRVAKFLQIGCLLEEIMKTCIDIHGPLSKMMDCRNHMRTILFTAQEYSDCDLMERVLEVINKKFRSPSLLMDFKSSTFTKDTWKKVMYATREAFMFTPGVFVVYKGVFDIPDEEMNSMIEEFREGMFDSAGMCSKGFTEILAGFHANLSFRGRFATPKNIGFLPIMMNLSNLSKASTQPIITFFNYYVIATIIRDPYYSEDVPQWLKDVVGTIACVKNILDPLTKDFFRDINKVYSNEGKGYPDIISLHLKRECVHWNTQGEKFFFKGQDLREAGIFLSGNLTIHILHGIRLQEEMKSMGLQIVKTKTSNKRQKVNPI